MTDAPFRVDSNGGDGDTSLAWVIPLNKSDTVKVETDRVQRKPNQPYTGRRIGRRAIVGPMGVHRHPNAVGTHSFGRKRDDGATQVMRMHNERLSRHCGRVEGQHKPEEPRRTGRKVLSASV